MKSEQSPQRVSQREFARLEGCDEKQVRRGIASGKLIVDAEGKLDVSQVGSGWRRPRRDSKSADNSAPADMPPTVRASEEQGAQADAPEVSSFTGHRLKEAVAKKEDFAGRLKELEFLQKSGELVPKALAERVLFEEARAYRDTLLNWPTRVSALIAADLEVDADRVAEVLTGHVHKLLASLADPAGDFTARS
jgi:hypothetical protein